MRRGLMRPAPLVLVVLLATTATAAQQAGSSIARTPLTSWGHPDLQGIWSTATITPFERPTDLAGKEFLTAQEAADFERRTLETNNRDRRGGSAVADVGGAYNEFWFDRGTKVVPTRRTSLVIDPPDGRIPPMTADAQKRLNGEAEARKARGPADNPEDFSLWVRCIVRGVPTVMLPQGYNSNYQIYQTPEYVVIVAEMIHEARIIPLNGRPHLPRTVRQWMGDSVGRWEGDTLIVETTNFSDKAAYRGTTANLRLVERFTRTAPDVLQYRLSIDDPTTFTRPWTVELSVTPTEGKIYEYSCHEANYALEGMLRGARAQEKKAAEEAAKKTPK